MACTRIATREVGSETDRPLMALSEDNAVSWRCPPLRMMPVLHAHTHMNTRSLVSTVPLCV
jgi:hypothetical protein